MKIIYKIFFYIFLFPLCWTLSIPGESYSKKTDHVPSRVATVVNTVHRLIEKKKISRAIDILESYQRKSPKKNHHYLVCFALGNCYVMSKRLDDAVTQYKTAVQINPGYLPAWINLGRACFDLGMHHQAGNTFLKGYAHSKEKNPEMLYYGAISFLSANQPEEALKIMKQLFTLHKQAIKLEWTEIAARIYLALDRKAEALPFIRDLAEKSSGKKRKQWQEILLYQYISLDMTQKALGYAGRLTRDDPLDSKWWKGLAHLHLLESRLIEALTAMKIYHYLVPLTKQEKVLMADLSMSASIPAQSIPFYKEVLLDQMDMEVVKKLAYAYINTYHPEKAIMWIEKGLKNSHDDMLLFLKGNILYGMKKYPEAAAMFEKAIKLKKNNPRGLMMLGYASMNAGKKEKARIAFQRASQYPEYKNKAKDALKYLDLLQNN